MKNNYKKKAILIILIIALIIFLRFIGIENYINFQIIQNNREYLLSLVNKNYFISALIFVVIYILSTALFLPVAIPLTLTGGFLFGVFIAVILVNIGATIGAACTFLIVRYLLGNFIQAKYADKLNKFNNNIELYGANYLLLARFIALIPFFVINLLAGLTKIPLKTFIWTTSVGIIPGSIIYAYAGRQIIGINSLNEIFSPKIIIAFLLLVLFGLLSIAIKYKKINKI